MATDSSPTDAPDSSAAPQADHGWTGALPSAEARLEKVNWARPVTISPRETRRTGLSRHVGLRISSPYNSPVHNGNDSDVHEPATGEEDGDGADNAARVVRLSNPVDQPCFRSIPAQPQQPASRGKSGRSKRWQREWGVHQPRGVRWIISSGLGVVALVTLALVVQQQWLAVPPEEGGPTLQVVEEKPYPEIEGFESTGASQVESRDLLTRYARAAEAGDVLPLIRNRASLGPILRLRWQPWDVPENWSTPLEAVWTASDDSGRPYGLLEGFLPNDSPFRAYFVREDGNLKLDWLATTAYSDTDFDKLGKGEGGGGVTRAYVEADTYFTSVFPEEIYACFKLVSPDFRSVVWGYTPRAGATAKAMEVHFPGGLARLVNEEGSTPMTLDLERGPEGARPNQWLIARLLHHEWVTP